MNKDDFDKLNVGDVIYRRATKCVVVGRDADGMPLAVPAIPVTDPELWGLAHKAKVLESEPVEAGNSFGQVAAEPAKAKPKKRARKKKQD